MSVVNGQLANQTTFNQAFMSRTSATTSTVATVALENTLPVSGAFVVNLQRAINKIYEGLGTTGEADTAINDYANQNYITNGDNRKIAVEKLDAQLKQTQDDLDVAEADIASLENRVDIIESQDSTFGGNKTFTGNVVVEGDFEVQGTTTSINSTDLEVEDAYVTINKGGTDMSAEDAGLEVERPSGNAALQFDSALASKWKIGLLSAMYEVIVSGVSQVIAGAKQFTDGIFTDTIGESTLNAGVTVDGVLIKDGLVDGEDVSSLGSRLTQAELDIDDTEARLDVIESQNSTFGGDKIFSDDVQVQGNASFKNIAVAEEIFLGAVINTQTGADQEITTVNAPIVKLTGAGLASIEAITPPTGANKLIMFINQTGADVIFKDNIDNIRTGTGADVQLGNNQPVFATFDDTTSMWYLHSVGGSGSGGAGGSKTIDMKLNGLIGGAPAQNGVDGFWITPSNIQITNVFIYQEVAGGGGTTELDLKVKPFLSGVFTSIFLTTPKVVPAAGANAWCGVGDTVTGCIAPVLSSLPFAVAAKSALRMDLIQAQTGNAAGCGLIIVYEEI